MTERQLDLCRKALIYMATGLEMALDKKMIVSVTQEEAAKSDALEMRSLANAIMDEEVK